MALPKRKISKSRRDKRRTHWKLTIPEIGECPQCHAMRMAYHVCPSCGFYRGRQVLEIKEKKEKKGE